MGRVTDNLPKPPDDPKQSDRFTETAKSLDVDESGAAFDRLLNEALRPPDRSADPEHESAPPKSR